MFWGASDEFLLFCANIQTILAFFSVCNAPLEIGLYSFWHL